MQATFFEVKLTHVIVTEKGQDKIVRETIVTNDELLTAAINKVEQHVINKKLRDHRILGGKLTNLKEVHQGEGEKIFKTVVDWVLEINDKGVKKIERYPMLIQADDIDEAKKTVEELNRGVVSDWVISELKESNVSDLVLN